MEYQDLLLFLSGLISGLITGFCVEYFHHYLSVKRSKKEEFLPYLRRLYGNVSKIMDKTVADGLNALYEKLINVAVLEELRLLRIGKLTGNESIKELLTPVFPALPMFLFSYTSLIGVVRECKRFESTYIEMEKRGLIETLEVHDRRLYRSLSSFHDSASYIVEETSEIMDKLETTYESKKEKTFEKIFEVDVFQTLLKISTHDLFRFGSRLQKQLRKLV